MQTPEEIRATLRELDQYERDKIAEMEKKQNAEVRHINGSTIARLVEAGLVPATKRPWWQRLARQRLAIALYAALALSAYAGTTWLDWGGNVVHRSPYPLTGPEIIIPLPLPGPSSRWWSYLYPRPTPTPSATPTPCATPRPATPAPHPPFRY